MNTELPVCDRCKGSLEGFSSTIYEPDGEQFKIKETVCQECFDEEVFKDFQTDNYVCKSLLLNASLGVYTPNTTKRGKRKRISRHDYKTESDRKTNDELMWFLDKLQMKTLEFQGGVWFDAGLREHIDSLDCDFLSSKYRGWHGYVNNPEYDGFEMDVRCASSAGRFMITFQSTKPANLSGTVKYDPDSPAPGTQITWITEEKSRFHRMGWQSVNGKADHVLTLADIAIHGWGQSHRAQLSDAKIDFCLVRDDQVSIM